MGRWWVMTSLARAHPTTLIDNLRHLLPRTPKAPVWELLQRPSPRQGLPNQPLRVREEVRRASFASTLQTGHSRPLCRFNQMLRCSKQPGVATKYFVPAGPATVSKVESKVSGRASCFHPSPLLDCWPSWWTIVLSHPVPVAVHALLGQ